MSGIGEEGLTPETAFAFLLGTWTLAREISGQATMTGRAEILMEGDGAAAYCEEVAVTMRDGAEFRGSQRYLVRRTEEGFAFLFAETGALFEELRFGCRIEGGGLRAEAVHVCGEDRYVSEYVLGPGRAFSIQHAVAGPRKRYTSVTRFTGVAEDRPGARELL